MSDYETTISFRTTKLKKAQIKEVIDNINHERDINEPKLNYKILQDVFLENINNDKLKLQVEKLELKEQIKQLTDKKKYIEFKLKEYDLKLKEIENKINETQTNINKPINPRLEKALNSFFEVCQQRGYTDITIIPNELYTATAQSNEIKRTDLIRMVKKELKANPNLIIDYPNVKFNSV